MARGAMIGIAGIRGIVGETLTAEDFVAYALGFGTLVGGGKVVVGRDTRPSGEMILNLVCGALLSTGCEVIDIGIVPTPTVGIMVREKRARGGIAITASHNPLEWNALKFFRRDGTLARSADHRRLLDLCKRGGFRRTRFSKPLAVAHSDDAPRVHIKRILDNIDARAIARRNFKVVLDCCNGAGARLIPSLLEQLRCRTSVIFGETDKPFGRPAEPLPENLGALSRRVRREGADIGFAIDPDADRLAVVDEQGRPVGEERSVTIAAWHVLRRRKSPLVVNLSTTRAIDDVAKIYGVGVHRTAVGEAYVVEAMRRRRAVIGGEGNGGVIWPKVAWGRDAASGIALILEALAESGGPISALNGRIPDYAMLKKRLPLERERLKAAFSRLEKRLGRGGKISRGDGLRIDFPGGWFHLRPSNTEPIVRLFAEAPTAQEAEALAAEVEATLKEISR